MKKTVGILVIILIIIVGVVWYFMSGINENTTKNNLSNDNSISDEVNDNGLEERGEEMVIRVSDGIYNVTFELNDSDAARSLYEQLPLTLDVEDFSSNEKIFYPESKLNIGNTPVAEGGSGVLAYYEPWGDVVMFYDSFSSNSSLYELGKAIEGTDKISELSGEIKVERLEN